MVGVWHGMVGHGRVWVGQKIYDFMLHSKCPADQCLCFHLKDSRTHFLCIFEILYMSWVVRKPVFSIC